MNLLERYIYGRATFAFLAVLFSLAGVIWIIQALTKVDIFSTNGQSLLTYFSMTLLAVPGLLLAVIPIALLISTANTINSLNSNSELVIISAAGAPNASIAKPFLVLALICCLFSGFVGHFGMPWSFTKLKQFTSEMNADLLTIIVREGEFNTVEQGLVFHVGKRHSDGSLGGILVSDKREKDKENIYLAKRGVIVKNGNTNLLQLSDGEIQQKDIKTNQSSIIKFTSYVIDMSTFGGPKAIGSRRPKERFTTELLTVDPNDSYFKKRPNSFQIEIHERFAEMLWPFANVLVLLAFAGTAKSSRQGHGSALFTAAMILLGLKALSFVAQNAANSNINAIYFLYVIPLVGIAYGIWCLISNSQAEMPRFMLPISNKFSQMHERNMQRWADIYLAFRRKIARS